MEKKKILAILVVVVLVPRLFYGIASAQTTPTGRFSIESNPSSGPLLFNPTNLFNTAASTPAFTPSTGSGSNIGSGSICSDSGSGSPWLNFFGDAAKVGLPIFLINIITSTLADPPSGGGSILGFGFNFNPGGMLEPLDEASDFLFNKWLQVVFYGFLASIAVWVASYLLEIGIALNLSLSQSAVITTGYGIIMALTNISFVIGIVVIAFATMFRKAGWDAQSILMRLIIAVLLVNFSLFLALGVANVGTRLTEAFVNGGTPLGATFAKTYNVATIYCNVAKFMNATSVNGVNPSQLDPSDPKNINKISIDEQKSRSFWDKYVIGPMQSYFIMVVGIILAVILTIIGALTLIAIFLFLVVRYVALTILLIFAPLAWLGFAFPKLNLPIIGNAWSGWWTIFLRWTFLGPLLAFLLYLTTEMVKHLGDPATIKQVAGLGLAQGLVQMIVITIFSLAGLYAANKLSAAGATVAYGLASKMGGMALAKLKTTGKEAGIRLSNSVLGSEKVRGLTAKIQKTSIPILKPLGKQLNVLGAKTEKLVSEDKFKDLSPQRLAALVPTLHGPDRVAALLKLAKGGDVNDLKDLDKHLNKETEALFKSYGKKFDEVEKTIGMNIATYQALKKGTKEGREEAKKASEEFFRGFNQKDFSKLRISDSYNDKKVKVLYGLNESMNRAMREAIAAGLVDNSGYINKAASGIKSESFSNYTNEILKSKLPDSISIEIEKRVTYKGTNQPAIGVSFKEAEKDPEKYTISSERASMSKEEVLQELKTNKEFKETLMKSLEQSDPTFKKSFERMTANREVGTMTFDTDTQPPI